MSGARPDRTVGTPRQVTEEPWVADARCKGLDPNVFHPERGGDYKTPKAICAECPVKADCLECALVTGQHQGVWGGASERERRVLRRQRNAGRIDAARCGTTGGYEGHRRRAEAPCEPCRLAHNAYQAAYHRQRKAAVS